MLKRLVAAGALAASALAQGNPQVELANLREDVRGLVQRMGELALRLEQLERENAELRRRAGAAEQGQVTLAHVHAAVEEAAASLRAAIAASKAETLHQVAAQLEKLGKQTNAALADLARHQAPRAAGPAGFSDNYAKEGVSYTVQKGDSLASIAKKTGAKQQDIVNANKLSDPSRIVVGQTLFIPGAK